MSDKIQLDVQEQELLDSYERDEWNSIHSGTEMLGQYQEYAIAALDQAGVVSILLPQDDLGMLRKRAAEAGVSYQALIANVLHLYISGQLVEKPRGV